MYCCLITDVGKLTVNRAGKVIGKSSLLRGVPLPCEGETWTWRLAPRPEADSDYSHYREVVGVPSLKTTQISERPVLTGR